MTLAGFLILLLVAFCIDEGCGCLLIFLALIGAITIIN